MRWLGRPHTIDLLSPGTPLALGLAPAAGALQARVVHSCELGDGAWQVGCRFDHPLGDDDLQALAGGPGQPKREL